MNIRGWALNYFNTSEWQTVDQRLRELDQQRIAWNPGRLKLFKALEVCPLDRIKCVLVGQDPYPNPAYATGLAFSIPAESEIIPPTLAMMIQELQADVEEFSFKHGNLTHWAQQGVLLWNAIPSCLAGKSKSHKWAEYEPLTAEVFNRVSNNYAVFAFLGSTASQYDKFVNKDKAVCLYTSHPSPRGMMRSQKPFLGSRIFSTINGELMQLGKSPVDWSIR